MVFISGKPHQFKHIATYMGLKIYVCEDCLCLIKRGDTYSDDCLGAEGTD